MLAVEAILRGFIEPQEIADTSKSREVILGLSAESRGKFDELTGRVVAGGGKTIGEPEDQGFMYMRGFETSTGIGDRSSTWTWPR